MKYEKAMANVVEFEAEDIIVTSGAADCGNPSFFEEADKEFPCDGQNQHVNKLG